MMSNRVGMLLTLAGVAAAFPCFRQMRADNPQHGTAVNTEIKRINDLVAQLGSSEFLEREQATKNLIAAGAPALEYLQKAMANPDAEIRRRAGLILTKIEKDIDTARLLKPKQIRLFYRDTPITEAVADFAKKSSYPIQFEGDRVRLATRKVNLDTGDVTFWEALDQFCRAAGLKEQLGAGPASAAPPVMDQRERMALAELRMMQRRGMAMPPARVDFGRIVLLEGQEKLPISQAGGVRMRLLRPGTPISGHANSSEEAVLALEVTPEPGIDWRGVLEAQVAKAVDLQNREVKQIQETRTPCNNYGGDELACAIMVNAGANNAWVVNGGDIEFAGNPAESPRREFPIRLKLNDRNIKGLREIRGVLFAQVQSPQEPVIRATQILQAEGKTFRGPENSYVKVHEVRRADKGQITLRLTLRPPSMGEDALGMFQGAVFVRRFNGRMAFMAQQEGESATAQKFALLDQKGRNFHLVSSEDRTQANGMEITQELRLTYQSKQGLEEPAQLIYSGQRLVTVEIPFDFKDVSLSK